MMISRISFIAVLTFLLTSALSLTSCSSPGNINSLDNIRMTATINGLGKGEEATLTLSLSPGTDPAGKPLFQQTVRSDEESLTVEIITSLEDGYYLLLLEAPGKYFREPKGYLFAVNQSQIVNPVGRPVIFDLIPREETPVMVEALISLSAPLKRIPPNAQVKGLFSGLKNSDDLVTIHIYDTYTGKEKLWGTHEGNGPWEVGIITAGDVGHFGYYTITAEAKGYTTQPDSYIIRIVDDTAYVVSNNETGEEALHLDFQFLPNNP